MPQPTTPILPAATRRLAEMTTHRAYTYDMLAESTGMSSTDIASVLRGDAVMTDAEVKALADLAGMSVVDFLDPDAPLGNPFGEQGRKVERIVALRQMGASSDTAIDSLVAVVPTEHLTKARWQYANSLVPYFQAIQKDPSLLTDAFIKVFAQNVGVSVKAMFALPVEEIKTIRSYRRAIKQRDAAHKAVAEAQKKLEQHEKKVTAMRQSMSEAARREVTE